ncbi:MAG: NAD-dependent epimerase/dehydratase family protein [Prevotella sp.]
MGRYIDDIFSAASEALPWELLEGKNILVTGATGLIGGCLVEVLMAHGGDYNIYAAGRNETRAGERFARFVVDKRFHFFRYDVSKPLETELDFHYVIHAASGASPSAFASQPVEVVKANVFGVANLMDYGISHNMQRMLYVSTGEIYGEGGATLDTPDGKAFTEADSGYVNCATQRACYPSSKRAAETLCIAYGTEYGADVVIARPCHVYGPNFTENDNRVYAQFFRNIQRDEDIVMKSDGSQYRSWCYVVDCVRALLYILLKGENGEAYNIADEKSNITIRQLAEMIASIGGRKVVIKKPDNQEASGYNVVTKSIFSTEKLQGLGWSVKGSMSEKLSHLASWLNLAKSGCDAQ